MRQSCRFLPRFVALTLALIGLSACADRSLQDLREAQYSGSAFQQALALEYRTLAEDQAAAYDWNDSNLFAQKGLAAAYGESVAPENPAARKIAGTTLSQLEAARQRLLAISGPAQQEQFPQKLARAWSQYDCWVEHQEENWQTSVIASCRENFEALATELEASHAVTSSAVVPTDIPNTVDADGEDDAAPAPVAAPANALKQDFYVLLFRLNSSEINDSGKAKIAEIAKNFAGRTDWQIMLNGHTDRTGAAEYNMALSERRAQAVKAQFVKLGLNASQIQTFAFGETDPAVPTDDGVKMEANRRVEILLN